MDELPARAKTVLRHAQDFEQCRDQDARRRVREGVAKAVGASAFDASLAHGSSREPHGLAQPALPPTGSAPLAGLAAKLTAATVLVALVGAGVAVRHRAGQPPAAVAGRSAVVAPAAADPRAEAHASGGAAAAVTSPVAERLSASQPPPAVTAAELRPVAPREPPRDESRSAQAHAGRHVRAASRDTLDVEVALLRQLGAAVARGDSREARLLLARHQARFAQPALLEERQGFQALVRCMDHSPGALASSRAFAARYPNSVLTARVLRECEPTVVER